MTATLYARLSLALAGLLILVGVLFAVLTISATRDYLQEVNQRFNRDLARNLVADRNLVQEGTLDKDALKETFHHYMVVNPSIEIYLLDLDGRILAYSADPGKVKRHSVSLGPIGRFLDGVDAYPLLGDDPRSHDLRKAFSATPIPSATAPEGYLYVILRGEAFDSVDALIQESYFLRLSGWAVTVSLVLGLFLGLVLFRLLTRRIERLGRTMEAFRRSNFTTLVQYRDDSPRRTDDEIDRLGLTFEAMARRIIDQIQALTEKDAMRRELVAQVSHDLRTPLASLHGYLETLRMKESSLQSAERSEYLDIALGHSERLRRLVEDLFDLAKLDAKDTRPAVEPVAIAELAQDVVQQFRLAAQSKGICLELERTDELPFVQADIGLIERVLENLIDNAIRHTPRSGRIRVSTRLQGTTVSVQVHDTGSGIPPEDLPRIFDRFFQVSERNGDNHHAGLGLAIAKRILDLHDSHIGVVSTPGAGTTFTFALPIWRPAG
ncbi:MAG: ATP-binding protein [Pseudomonadota bacterium]|nr:ATP-binding protein [Pseudomonadota bacterium]